jgi:hypothetical protein
VNREDIYCQKNPAKEKMEEENNRYFLDILIEQGIISII